MLQSRLVRRLLTVTTHIVLWAIAFAAALYLRFDLVVPPAVAETSARVFPLLIALRVVVFWRAGLFHGILRYAGVRELRSVVRATSVASVAAGLCGLFIHHLALPRSIYILEWLTALAVAAALRLAVRIASDRSPMLQIASNAPGVIVLGAGNAGELLIRDLQRSHGSRLRVACVLDDDPSKFGSLLHGIRVHGPIDRDHLKALSSATGASRAILAMPTAPGMRTREILSFCRELGIELKTLPSLQQLTAGDIRFNAIRDVAIDDLLRREPVSLDTPAISEFVADRTVLVTGAAGSIGSELVRQIARFQPRKIVLVDHNENGMFFVERELRQKFPDIVFDPRLGDIRDPQRVAAIFSQTRPDVVYHAAAHKHVPLMEENPTEAVRNNVLGTRVLADEAARRGCEAFVLISTDKAVNPTSVMGTTKRIAEMYVQSLAARSRTRFVAVRFGNVLGSAGSVVPIFRAQLEAGGPIKVTHPEMRRYFMTIPEASQLVIQASVLGRGGEIFILDMGELVKIVDLARDMIQLSGLRPDVDVGIEFTGVRPGEKLFEELLLDGEKAAKTVHPKIRVARIAPPPHDEVTVSIDRLGRLAMDESGDQSRIRAALGQIVPEATLVRGDRAESIEVTVSERESPDLALVGSA